VGKVTEVEELSELIGDIYDASLDVSLWRPVLEKTAAFMETATAALCSTDSRRPAVNFASSWGDDPAYRAVFLERYTQFSPSNLVGRELAIGEVCAFSSQMSSEEFRATDFYEDWVRPQGFIDVAEMILEKSGSAMAALSGVRHEQTGHADQKMVTRMKLLAPHFRRAVLIGKVIDLKTVEAAAFSDMADGLAAGVFLVDSDARIVHANQSGRLLLAAGTVVERDGKRLRLTSGSANASLLPAIKATSGSEFALASRGTGIPVIGHDGKDYIAHVLPLASGNRRLTGVAHGASSAVFIRRAELDLDAPVASLSHRYGLTPAEARVLRALLQHGGVQSIAASVGTSAATVKTHLLHVFEKTETNTQADLVKLTLGFADPLARAS
jgi:DNA-binding CsgD family transcriptional regulator